MNPARDPRDTSPVEPPTNDWTLDDTTKHTGRAAIARIRQQLTGVPQPPPPPELIIESEEEYL